VELQQETGKLYRNGFGALQAPATNLFNQLLQSVASAAHAVRLELNTIQTENAAIKNGFIREIVNAHRNIRSIDFHASENSQ
jgi:hypothetical protein